MSSRQRRGKPKGAGGSAKFLHVPAMRSEGRARSRPMMVGHVSITTPEHEIVVEGPISPPRTLSQIGRALRQHYEIKAFQFTGPKEFLSFEALVERKIPCQK